MMRMQMQTDVYTELPTRGQCINHSQPEAHILKFILKFLRAQVFSNNGGSEAQNTIYSIMNFLGAQVPHIVQGLPKDFSHYVF